MLSESGNSTCTEVAKNLVSDKTGFVMAAILAKTKRGGTLIGYTPNAVGPDRFIHKSSLSILEFRSHYLKQTYQEEYHQVPQQ